MYTTGYFNSRFLNAYYFNGGSVLPEVEKEYFSQNTFRSKYWGLQHFSRMPPSPAIPVEITVGSIALEILPNTANQGETVTVIAYVYDNFNKAMPIRQVTFASSNTSILTAPAPGFTDTLGRVVRTLVVGQAGTTTLTAYVEGFSAFTSITVTAVSVGSPAVTITQGATIQAGSSGGGTPGPIRVVMRRQIKRWPTR
jgi:hypothetical protein